MKRMLFLLLGVTACLDVAEERALRDQTIGRADADGINIAVDDGLARVLAVDSATLRLWASAPAIDFDLSSRDGGSLMVEAQNVVADAELQIDVPVTSIPTVIPTQKRWSVQLPAGTTLRASIRPPDYADVRPWRFLALADVQEAIEEVQDIYAVMNRDPRARFVLFSGDLTEQGSEEELLRFKAEAEELRIPIYATLGNHELGTRQDLFHDQFGRGSFSFLFRGARFTLLDASSATLDPLVYEWLEGWLEDGADQFHVVAMHIPPFDPAGARNGGFASRAEAGRLSRRLADHRVDLSIYGHVHSFYAYENAGVPAFITGGGGAIEERFDGVQRHYLAVDVDPSRGTFETAVVRIDE